jgi:cytidyltransferase-like protein
MPIGHKTFNNSTLPTLNESKLSKQEEIRIWMDGAFDMMHYGHMNAFRQGKSLGTTLIVGVNDDETITQCKGKPVFDEKERVNTVKACKWVDEVVEGVPYIMNEEYLSHVIQKYKIDYVVHGDDPCIVDGKDVYESAKKLGINPRITLRYIILFLSFLLEFSVISLYRLDIYNNMLYHLSLTIYLKTYICT